MGVVYAGDGAGILYSVADVLLLPMLLLLILLGSDNSLESSL